MTDIKKLIEMGQEFRGQPDQYSELITELADTLEAVYADSLTGQAMHALWQERAEKLEAAIRRALGYQSVLPAIATAPRKVLEETL